MAERGAGGDFRALYAPIALISLPLVWMIAVTMGFSFIFWGVKSGTSQRSFEVSGSSLFTLGFAEPAGRGRIWLTFVEATIGLGLVALLISYLPTIYAAHHEREKGIIVFSPFAGTPTSPVDLISNLQRLGTLDSPDLWRTAGSWLLELDQTHSPSRPSATFPSRRTSVVGGLGGQRAGRRRPPPVGDGSAREIIVDKAGASRSVKGPMMALAYGMPSLVRIGMSAGLPIHPSVLLMALMARDVEEPAPMSVRREEYMDALDRLNSFLPVPESQREDCWRRFAWIRSGYDQARAGSPGSPWRRRQSGPPTVRQRWAGPN